MNLREKPGFQHILTIIDRKKAWLLTKEARLGEHDPGESMLASLVGFLLIGAVPRA
jgi:hypothetical protein